jgi:hypothetical protein
VASRVKVYQTVACWEEQLWVAREGVPMDGFASDSVPALNGLSVVDRDVERVFAGIASREWLASVGSMILHGEI